MAIIIVGIYNIQTKIIEGHRLLSNSPASDGFVVTTLRNISTAMTSSPNR
jgi:hypothetical protein